MIGTGRFLRTAIAPPFVAFLTFLSACAATDPRAVSPQQREFARAVEEPHRLDPPAYLPAAARAALRARMAGHAALTAELVSAVMILSYPHIQELARSLASSGALPRPAQGEDPAALLPERFFQLQDWLEGEATDLAAAATRQDALASGEAFGRLSRTCVDCHAVYRNGTR